MKLLAILLFISICWGGLSQAPLHSDKYAVALETSSFDAQTAPSFERMLNEDIVSIQLVTLYPQQVGDSIRDSTGNMVPGRVFRFESILQDSVACVDLIKSRKTLHHDDVEDLIGILYAYLEQHSRGSCYSPRHGILYIDLLGNHLGFIEICFECDVISATRSTYVHGLDSAHYLKLKQMFRKYLGDEMSVYDTRR